MKGKHGRRRKLTREIAVDVGPEWNNCGAWGYKERGAGGRKRWTNLTITSWDNRTVFISSNYRHRGELS